MFNKTKNTQNVQLTISEQIKDVKDCLVSFEAFIHAACTPGTVFETLDSLALVVDEKESVADHSLRAMIDSLGKGSYLPSTREDLIAIASKCDSIANKCESAANSLVFQRFTIPVEFKDKLVEIISITHQQFGILETSIAKLFSEFGELTKDHSILDDIRNLESDVDTIEKNMYREIFKMDLGLAEKNQIAKFVESICDISDTIENIADKIQIMIIARKA